MGAWGYGSFENDSALDWLGEIQDGDASIVGETLDSMIDTPIGPEVDECCAALAAAEMVAAALGKGDDRLPPDALQWLEGHRKEVAGIGTERARLAVERVFKKSELRELWDENGDDTEWHADVRALLKRLKA